MTAKELGKYVGRTGDFFTSGFVIEVRVVDARYGRNGVEVQVEPVRPGAAGLAWTSAKNLAWDVQPQQANIGNQLQEVQ